MNYVDSTNKLFIFIGWWVNYPPFFKNNREKTLTKTTEVSVENVTFDVLSFI